MQLGEGVAGMKNWILAAVLLCFAAAMTGCAAAGDADTSSLQKSSLSSALPQEGGVALAIKEESVSAGAACATLVLENQSETQYTYGEQTGLETYRDGSWYAVPMLENAAWTDIGYLLYPGNTRENVFNIQYYYGKLSKGKYRAVKTLYPEKGEALTLTADFTVG